MTKNEFKARLAQGDLEVTFIKKTTGEERTITCTANIPEEMKKSGLIEIGEMASGPIVVYSTKDKGFRSFYLDSLIEVKDAQTTFGLIQE